jgi:hypothetical protein
MGSKGRVGPTLGALVTKVSKRATKLLTLIIIPTVGLHTGVAGTEAAASKIDEIKLFLLNENSNVDLQDYKIRQNTPTVFATI